MKIVQSLPLIVYLFTLTINNLQFHLENICEIIVLRKGSRECHIILCVRDNTSEMAI